MPFVFFDLEQPDRGRVNLIHFQPDHPEHGLSPEKKAEGIEVAEIPTPQEITGHAAVLYINPLTLELWFEYVERELTPKEQEEKLGQEILNLKLMGRLVTKDKILANELTEEELLSLVGIYPNYEVGVNYAIQDIINYKGKLYEVIQAHTSQESWLPENTPALYTSKMPAGTIPEWQQPTGSHDAYNIGDLVTFEGVVWESEVDSNTWQPGVYGWELDQA